MSEPYLHTTEYTHFLRFREGDQQSLAWLYRHLHPILLRRGLHILPDEFAVSTAIQDAFLKAWTLRQRIESPKHLYCFLRLVTRWGCLDWYKRPENKLIRFNEPEALDTVPDDSLLSEEERRQADHQQEEMLHSIQQVLPFLPAGRQNILTLHFKQGLSHGQIARRYDRPTTVISRELQKGVDQVKRIIHINLML
jgi:RNA polymerase sigma factor (sigma-70 family)